MTEYEYLMVLNFYMLVGQKDQVNFSSLIVYMINSMNWANLLFYGGKIPHGAEVLGTGELSYRVL